MSKEINTELKFTDKTTTGTNTVESFSTYFCKYYLPCGKCDKTGQLCSNARPIIKTFPDYPWWNEPYYYKWWGEPTCTWTSNTYTTSTPFGTDGKIVDNKTVVEKPEWWPGDEYTSVTFSDNSNSYTIYKNGDNYVFKEEL